jgi:subtilase family serine protease
MSARRRCDLRPNFDHLDGRVLLSSLPLVHTLVRHHPVHRKVHRKPAAHAPTQPHPRPDLSPKQIWKAYGEHFGFTINGQPHAADGTGQTIAIVVGGLDPNIANDLAAFDQASGLPDPPNFWSVYAEAAQDNECADGMMETSLDVEWAHAIAPGANILLVQAASMSVPDLMAAVDWARQQPGVSVVSMSWGDPESCADAQYDGIFTTPAGHTGVTFVAASGDSGCFNSPGQVGVSWPAACPNVLSVGGTTLLLAAHGRYAGESAWSGGGGGVSQVYAEPSYQDGVQSTGARTVPDVSYDGDPATGVAIYDSQGGDGAMWEAPARGLRSGPA